MINHPSDTGNGFPEYETQKALTKQIMTILGNKEKTTGKEPKPAKKSKKTVGKQDLASRKEKAKPKKTAKPRSSAGPNKTQQDLKKQIMTILENREKTTGKESKPVKKAKKPPVKEESFSAKASKTTEKAKPKKTAKPRSSADPDKTQQVLTKRIMTILEKEEDVPTTEGKLEVKAEKPKIKDLEKVRALMRAVKKGRFKKVKRLVEEGVDVNQINRSFMDSKEDRIIVSNRRVFTPLTTAIWKGDEKIVKYLLEHGANPDGEEDNLIDTIYARRKDIVELLIEHGANVNQFVYTKRPLREAVRIGDIDIVKLLLKNGADVNQQDNYGQTPIDWAAYDNNIEIVKLLLKNGADVNQPANVGKIDIDGSTPFMSAVYAGDIDIIKLFLENGAKPTSKDLDSARQQGDREIIQLLEAKMSGAGVMGAMESALSQKLPSQEIPLDPESFAQLHNGRSPIREVLSSAPPPKETADQSIKLGFDLLEHGGDIQSVEAYFRKALELEPENITALTNLGVVLCKQGKYESAEIHLTKALRLCSDNQKLVEIRRNLAIALFKQNKIQGAENQVKAVLKINPNDADAQRLLELIIAEQHKSAEGKFQAPTRKQIKPVTEPEKPKEPSSADERFQAPTRKQIEPVTEPVASDVSPSGTQPAEKSIPSSGDQFFGLSKPDEAPKEPIMEEITSIKEAIDLAKLFAEKNDYESARKYLEKAVELDPHSELAHRNLAFVYEMLANCEEEKENKNNHLRKAKEHSEKADELKAAAGKQADKAPTTGQIDALFRPFDNGPAKPVSLPPGDSEQQIIVESDSTGKPGELPPPPSPRQDQSQLQPGEERVKIEGLPEGQIPKPVPAVPPPLPSPPFTDAEWATGQLRESEILKEHEQGIPPSPPTVPSIKTIPRIAEDEKKLKLTTEVQEQFTVCGGIFRSIVDNFTKISQEEMNELGRWVKRYTKLLLENPKVHFSHNTARDHLISLKKRGWVSNEVMMDFMEALKKYGGLKKAK